jgi:hypothetical protein
MPPPLPAWVTFHAESPPAGAVEVSRLPLLSPITHKVVLGHEEDASLSGNLNGAAVSIVAGPVQVGGAGAAEAVAGRARQSSASATADRMDVKTGSPAGGPRTLPAEYGT